MFVSETMFRWLTSTPYILEKQTLSTSTFLTADLMKLLQKNLTAFLNFQHVKDMGITEFIF